MNVADHLTTAKKIAEARFWEVFAMLGHFKSDLATAPMKAKKAAFFEADKAAWDYFERAGLVSEYGWTLAQHGPIRLSDPE
jgi:hypothetical protein